MKKVIKYVLPVVVLLVIAVSVFKKVNINPNLSVGDRIDSLNGVYVYYNGGVSHTGDRNTAVDGYNLGITYQCVEFVKRYYYEYYGHKMPDSYGNAKDFFDPTLADSTLNTKRALEQFANPSKSRPREGDLVVYTPTLWNRYGHVAIVSSVSNDFVEIIQQNPGPFAAARERYRVLKDENNWQIVNPRILGWLRMPPYENIGDPI
ncbi:CHAP domain-containing protein [Sphingobacterium sp. lm-10]|uniref:CHAP domain-containing protein n=1 Tax=Sphingobacterium sp. lm-10 TaxID=2944904 RepID=UPI0020201A18|nr:CHAP domain-containing protein [Sphingobacterium sp. lm-10]MCL7987079.1 CHAP domain-containing protein [Sphingobacterium sp. lm-10]